MLREEVKYASKDYVNYLLDKQEYHNEKYTEYDIKQAFEKGAEWADEHPKSPWISVDDDLPCYHEELTHSNYTNRVFIAARNGFVEVAFMSKIENVWVWDIPIKVTHWMPMPGLPK